MSVSHLSRSTMFRNVPGFPGLVADLEGRLGEFKDGEFKPRAAFLNRDGYLIISARDDCGKKKKLYVHRAVLLAFVGPLPKGKVSRHLDGVKTNNHPSNLAYGTHQENYEDAVRHGTKTCNPRPARRNFSQSIIRIRNAITLVRDVASGARPQETLGIVVETLKKTERQLLGSTICERQGPSDVPQVPNMATSEMPSKSSPCGDINLTRRQRILFDWLFSFTLENGYQPSYREIMAQFGFTAPNSVKGYMSSLENKGWITASRDQGRAIRFLRKPDGTPFQGFMEKP